MFISNRPETPQAQILRVHYEWLIFEAIRYALWLTRGVLAVRKP
jgi:hypothetical protein